MGISISRHHVSGFPSNEVVQLLICGHGSICLRVGFNKWKLVLILCSIIIGTRYIMGSEVCVEELKSKLQASESLIKELIQKLNVKDATILHKQQSINELKTTLRIGLSIVHSVGGSNDLVYTIPYRG